MASSPRSLSYGSGVTSASPTTSPSGVRYLPGLFVALIAARLVTLHSFYLYDDAFITFRYAVNLAEGHGFVYNLGERVQGVSGPLWGLLLAVPQVAGLSIEWTARLLGIVFDVLTALLAFRLLRRENLAQAGVLLLFLFALDPYLAKQSVGGMESSLFLLVTLAATAFLLRGRGDWAATLAGMSVFVRPEGLLFCAVLAGFTGIERRRIPLRPLLIGGAVIAAGVLAQHLYYGDVIPASVRGKIALPRALDSVWSLALFPTRDPLQFVLTVVAAAGLPAAWRISRFVRIHTVWALALLAVWIVSGAHLWPWYCVPFWFFKVLVSAVAVGVWLRRFGWSRAVVRPGILAVLVVSAWLAFAVFYGRDRMETHVYSRIRHWASGRNFCGQTAYAMDFGALGYYTNLRVLDEPGLVWPKARESYHSDLRAILLGEKPDWAFVTRCGDNMRTMQSPEIARQYRPLWRASMAGDTGLDFERNVAPLWAADFVLYERAVPSLPE
jgi:hypothetical protein